MTCKNCAKYKDRIGYLRRGLDEISMIPKVDDSWEATLRKAVGIARRELSYLNMVENNDSDPRRHDHG